MEEGTRKGDENIFWNVSLIVGKSVLFVLSALIKGARDEHSGGAVYGIEGRCGGSRKQEQDGLHLIESREGGERRR
jgi:hypothetical protein